MEKKEMKEVIEWSVNVKWEGEWRNGPARPTMEAALKDAEAFMKKLRGKFLPVTFVRTIKYEAV
jgi:GH25 family lysozyme M1 (1,4-beta-N-acetylmuramidase)